jgi:hypothetical protein
MVKFDNRGARVFLVPIRWRSRSASGPAMQGPSRRFMLAHKRA